MLSQFGVNIKKTGPDTKYILGSPFCASNYARAGLVFPMQTVYKLTTRLPVMESDV